MFVLPIAAYLLFCAAYFDQKKNVVESVAVSWLFLTLFAWLFTEVSGAFGLFGTPAALAAWGALCLALAVYLIRKGLPRRAAAYFRTDGHMRGFWRENRANVICMAAFCTVVCLLAVLRSQNLIDNLEHRLPKIMHWIQNGRPGYFATETPQEINYTKLIEYMNAQIILLFGPDRVVNLVQIGAYLCSACCIYGVSRKLKASRSFAFLACWIYLLNPMIMIEVFTAQTDVAAGVYLLAFVYFLLDFIHADRLRMDRRGALEAVGLALSAMFGYLSKPTVCFAMVIFFLWMCAVRIVRRDSLKALAQFAVAGGLIAVILLVPDAVRKYEYQRIPNVIPESVETEESADGGEEEEDEEEEAGALADEYDLSDGVVNTLRQPKEFVIVCIRNLAANSTTRCFAKVNEWITRFVEKCERVLNYSGGYRYFRVMVDGGVGETSEPSPAIMFFLLAAWIVVIFRISRIDREQFLYMLSATLAMVVQAGLMSYTWYRQRYLIGVMAVLCPIFAVVVENIAVTLRMKLNLAAAMTAVCCFGPANTLFSEIPYVISGFHGGQLHQYLLHDESAELYYQLMIDYVNEHGYETVGTFGFLSYEQILWREIDGLKRLEHVGINPGVFAAAKLEDKNYAPQCIIMELPEQYGLVDVLEHHGMQYTCAWRAVNENGRSYSVLVPE